MSVSVAAPIAPLAAAAAPTAAQQSRSTLTHSGYSPLPLMDGWAVGLSVGGSAIPLPPALPPAAFSPRVSGMFVPRDPRAKLCRPWSGQPYRVQSSLRSPQQTGQQQEEGQDDDKEEEDGKQEVAEDRHHSPRSPRLSVAFSGRAGLCASEILKARDPSVRSLVEIVTSVAEQQREQRQLARAHAQIGDRVASLHSQLELVDAALQRLRQRKCTLDASVGEMHAQTLKRMVSSTAGTVLLQAVAASARMCSLQPSLGPILRAVRRSTCRLRRRRRRRSGRR
jgi:hypothetical protein